MCLHFLSLVPHQLEVIVCLPSEILCAFRVKRRTATTGKIRELEEEKREKKKRGWIDGWEREKEEE